MKEGEEKSVGERFNWTRRKRRRQGRRMRKNEREKVRTPEIP